MSDTPIHNHLVDVPPEDRMEALIEFLSSYIEHYHGGHVKMIGYSDGVLKVEMGGACEGCPMSNSTLHGWVEGTVRQFFPELKRVEDINE
jgi:Fe-S cluster biogenesis protein NfuA